MAKLSFDIVVVVDNFDSKGVTKKGSGHSSATLYYYGYDNKEIAWLFDTNRFSIICRKGMSIRDTKFEEKIKSFKE